MTLRSGSGSSFLTLLASAAAGKVSLGLRGTAPMASVLSYESLVHAVAGAVVRRGLHARAAAGCGVSQGCLGDGDESEIVWVRVF